MSVPTPDLPAEIEWVELELKLDATITVGAYQGPEPTEWMKPGCGGKVHFRGMPDEEQLRAAYGYLQAYMIAPALEEVIVQIQNRLVEQRRAG
jgi:hypothetical protein